MDYKKSAANLINLLKKYPLDAEEKEAIETAIGLLAWAALSNSRIKNLKDRQDDNVK